MKSAGIAIGTILAVPFLLLAAHVAHAGIYGTPWPMHTIDNYTLNGHLIGADGTRLGDLNKDGLPDIATGWEGGSATRVYLNPGSEKVKNPWPAVTVSSQSDAVEDAFFADLDGDGMLDVISSCEGGKRSVLVSWAPRNMADILDASKWTTEAIPCTVGVTRWMFADAMDIDGRNGIDLIVGAKEKNAMVGWLQAPADPRDLAGWKLFKLADCDWVMSLLAHDMDGDGDMDAVYSDRATVSWLENPGPAGDIGKPWAKHLVYKPEDPSISSFLTFADLDKDGLEDILCAFCKDGRIKGPDRDTKNGRDTILFARRLDASGANWETHNWGPYPQAFKIAVAADVNLDGKMDIVCSSVNAALKPETESGVFWLDLSGDFPAKPALTFHDISGDPGVKYDLVVALDLDGDGDVDVLTSEEAQRISDNKSNEGLGVVWYENPLK